MEVANHHVNSFNKRSYVHPGKYGKHEESTTSTIEMFLKNFWFIPRRANNIEVVNSDLGTRNSWKTS